MGKITVAMIVKNEESCLNKCLDSINDVGGLVIVDTGSTDDTVNIAKQYTDRIYTDYKWNDNFAEARNYACDKCHTDWIMTIDADEVLTNPEVLELAIDYAEKHGYNTISARINTKGTGNHYYQPRIYKSYCRWKGAIHNYLDTTGTYESNINIEAAHSTAHSLDPDRAYRILSKEVLKPGKVRELYYYAREFWYRKEYDKAIDWYNKYLKVGYWAPEMADAYLMIAKCYKCLNKYNEARLAAFKAVELNADYKEAIEFIADMVGPKNSERWLHMAYHANNNDVLFVNEPSEQPASYYDKCVINDTFTRYTKIYETVGKLVKGWNSVYNKVLDVGCGTASLCAYIDNYTGIDFSKESIKMAPECVKVSAANLYDYNYDGYHTYTFIEVLEHVLDQKILARIPKESYIIASVPSFSAKGHIRRYIADIIDERYRDVMNITHKTRFNLKDGKWDCEAPLTNDHITLFAGVKK